MENIFTYVTKSIDIQTSFLYDRREVVSAPMWSTDSSSLSSIFTSSNQHPHRKIYYMDVYSNSLNTASLHTEFSLAYGHYESKGSITGSSGFITSSTGVSESRAIYNQFKNNLLAYDNAKYIENGKFKFYGITNQIVGNYFWGKEYWLPFLTWQHPTKINIPGLVSNQLAFAKNISIGKSGKYDPNASIIVIVTNSNELVLVYPAFSTLWNMKIAYKLSETKDWESVSVGHGHILALKNDGTLWVSGDNEFGQLGLGYTGGDIVDLIQVGSDTDWSYVCAGATYSLAIKTDGTLWSWGSNAEGQLGLGDYTNRNTPTQVTSYGTDNWITVATSNAENFDEYQTVMGIQDDGTLWAWGDGNSGVTNFSPDQTIPYQLGVDTDWEKVSVGKAFAVAIKGGALRSWGSNDENGTLGMNNSNPSSFPFGCCIQTPSSDTDWTDISCGPDYVLGIKATQLYGWGNNKQFQLGGGRTNNNYLLPTKQNSKLGWSIIETAPYMAVGVIPSANENPVKNVISDDIYAISLNRWNFRDRIESGNWQLSLCAVDENNSPDINNIITLVDETIDYIGTSQANPTYKLHSLGGAVYGIYSGSLDSGIAENADKEPYGLLFPDNGTIILNGEMLYTSASIETKRTDPNTNPLGAFVSSSNAELLFTAISGAMSVGNPFIATTAEIKIPTYCFVRIHNYEYNYTSNPSYFDVVDDGKDSLVVKDKLRTFKTPFVYITTIGLYNDDGELLAVAKLSKPIRKTPSDELVIKVKLEI